MADTIGLWYVLSFGLSLLINPASGHHVGLGFSPGNCSGNLLFDSPFRNLQVNWERQARVGFCRYHLMDCLYIIRHLGFSYHGEKLPLWLFKLDLCWFVDFALLHIVLFPGRGGRWACCFVFWGTAQLCKQSVLTGICGMDTLSGGPTTKHQSIWFLTATSRSRKSARLPCSVHFGMLKTSLITISNSARPRYIRHLQ